jgi:MFS transporter, PHS family, inorganic phosphate transporter
VSSITCDTGCVLIYADGIGLSSPQFLAKTWGSLKLLSHAPPYQTDDTGNISQYDQFFDNSVHALVILNSGSALGMILMITFINRLNRRSLQLYGFLILAAIFIALGVVFITSHLSGGPVIIFLYILGQTAFNFGPNATTYIISGEAFPTRYRASCHGIAAGAGKLGSILVQLFSAYYRFGSTSTSKESTRRYGIIIIVFAAVMLLGAAITYFWLPDMQHLRKKGAGWTAVGQSKTLEELALGRRGVQSESVRRSRRSRN